MAASGEAHTAVASAADAAVAAFTDLNPDLTFTLEPFPEIDDSYSDCTDTTAPDPDNVKASVWTASRSLVVEPKRTTAELLDRVVAHFVADGWTTGTESNGDVGRAVYLSRDGYTLSVSGEKQIEDDRPARIGIEVSSPCIDAPEDIENWTPDTEDSASADG